MSANLVVILSIACAVFLILGIVLAVAEFDEDTMGIIIGMGGLAILGLICFLGWRSLTDFHERETNERISSCRMEAVKQLKEIAVVDELIIIPADATDEEIAEQALGGRLQAVIESICP